MRFLKVKKHLKKVFLLLGGIVLMSTAHAQSVLWPGNSGNPLWQMRTNGSENLIVNLLDDPDNDEFLFFQDGRMGALQFCDTAGSNCVTPVQLATFVGGAFGVGNPVPSGTNNTVLFVDGGGNLGSSNNLAWNNGTQTLTVGATGDICVTGGNCLSTLSYSAGEGLSLSGSVFNVDILNANSGLAFDGASDELFINIDNSTLDINSNTLQVGQITTDNIPNGLITVEKLAGGDISDGLETFDSGSGDFKLRVKLENDTLKRGSNGLRVNVVNDLSGTVTNTELGGAQAIKDYVASQVTGATGDNLGNHIATQDLDLNGQDIALNDGFLSNDGQREGIQIDNNGTVTFAADPVASENIKVDGRDNNTFIQFNDTDNSKVLGLFAGNSLNPSNESVVANQGSMYFSSTGRLFFKTSGDSSSAGWQEIPFYASGDGIDPSLFSAGTIQIDLLSSGGLQFTGGELGANVDGSTLEIVGGVIEVGAITSDEITDGEVKAADIDTNAVGDAELADNAVDTDAIQPSAISFAKLNTSMVITANEDLATLPIDLEGGHSNTIATTDAIVAYVQDYVTSVAGDNLGNHQAEQNLNMGSFKIVGGGIETSGNGMTIFSNGDVKFDRQVTSASDRRLKEDIASVDRSLDLLAQLEGKTFTWKETQQPSMGVIAQDVEEILPILVKTDYQGYKSVNYEGFSALFIEAINDLKEQNDAQSREIRRLKRRLEALES